MTTLTPAHVALLLVVLLLLFGAKRLPELGRSLGSGLREFKDSVSRPAAQPMLPPAQQQRDAASTEISAQATGTGDPTSG